MEAQAEKSSSYARASDFNSSRSAVSSRVVSRRPLICAEIGADSSLNGSQLPSSMARRQYTRLLEDGPLEVAHEIATRMKIVQRDWDDDSRLALGHLKDFLV